MIRRLDQRGGVGLVAALLLPLLLGLTAFAVDVGATELDTRRLQGVADAAALSAASNPLQAQALARQAVTDSGWQRAITTTVTPGEYSTDPGVAIDQRFTARASGTGAVRVLLESPSPSYFARMFGLPAIPISRTATAARQPLAAFSIGSRLAAVNGGLLNGYLGALTGSSVNLSVADYNALAGADVDLFGTLTVLNSSAHLSAASFNDILAAQVTRPQLLEAIAQALPAGDPSIAALRRLAAQTGGGAIPLAGLIDAGPLGSQSGGGTGIARVNVMALVTAALQLTAPTRQVALDLGAGIPGLSSTRVTLAIGERPASSPWIAITRLGTPIVRTAQARLYLESTLGNVALPGIGSPVALRTPIYVELASAEGRLTAIDCAGGAADTVTVGARPSLGQAAIAGIDPARLGDFGTAITLAPAHLVDTPLVGVDGTAQIDLGAAQAWQPLSFDRAAIDGGQIRTVSSNALSQGLAASLVSRTQLSVHVVGLPIPLTPLTQAVGSQLALIAPALDALIDMTTGSLGVHFGQADVRVTGLRCGVATLVA